MSNEIYIECSPESIITNENVEYMKINMNDYLKIDTFKFIMAFLLTIIFGVFLFWLYKFIRKHNPFKSP